MLLQRRGRKFLPNPSSSCVAPSFAPSESPILVALLWGAPSGKGIAWATGARASFRREFSMYPSSSAVNAPAGQRGDAKPGLGRRRPDAYVDHALGCHVAGHRVILPRPVEFQRVPPGGRVFVYRW